MSAAAAALASNAYAAKTTWTKGPYLQGLTANGVYIDAEIDPPGPMRVEVVDEGAPSPNGPLVVDDPHVDDFHSFHVPGLAGGHHYLYTVRSGDASATGHVTTPPPVDAVSALPANDAGDASVAATPFSFVVYGDNRTDDAAHGQVVRKVAETAGDFLVNTGDLVEDGADQDDWKTFFRIEGTILRDRCLFASVGNHELVERSGENYLAYFGPHDLGCSGPSCERPIRLYGTFRWANARFFLLNGMDDFATGIEKEWLAAELTRADAEAGITWRVVVVHHGPYSSGLHGDNERLDAAKIPELLAQHHVDLVLSGHDHIYERGFENGLRYVVSGGGGAPLYRKITPRHGSRKSEATHHIARFEILGDQIRMTASRVDGTVIERCGFSKSAADWDCDAPSVVASAAREGSSFGSSTAPPRKAASRCDCQMIGCTDSTAPFAFLGGASVVLLALVRRTSRPRSELS